MKDIAESLGAAGKQGPRLERDAEDEFTGTLQHVIDCAATVEDLLNIIATFGFELLDDAVEAAEEEADRRTVDTEHNRKVRNRINDWAMKLRKRWLKKLKDIQTQGRSAGYWE